MQIQSKFLRIILTMIGWGFAALPIGLLVVIGVFYVYSQDLPDPSKLSEYEPAVVTRLYTNDGHLLAEYATEHRLYLPLDEMPRRVISAFLSAEDKNFYEHGGIDFMSIARAMIVNLNNLGANRGLVGGSTITQQVVKNFFLSSEKSLERKIKEAILSFRISRIYSKDRILELYLNEIYLGYGSYGIAAAALNYFNKSLDELTVAETAFLAGLPKAPSNYNPKTHYERAKERRDYVLERMFEDGHISSEEYDIARATPINVTERAQADVFSGDFFAEEVRRELADEFGSNVLYKDGLYVKTTVDPTLQEYADKALRYALTSYDRRHGYRGPVGHIDAFDGWKAQLNEIGKTVPLVGQQKLAVVNSVGANSVKIYTDGDLEGIIPLAEMKWARKHIAHLKMGGAVSKASAVLSRGDVVIVSARKDKEGKSTGEYKLHQVPKVNGALVALDPHTGRVLAMSGGYSYMGSEFNRATQAKRQPGSAFKPFVYLAGLEAGLTPATLVLDAPIAISQGPGKPDWTPQNYSGDYMGSVTMRMGLEKSRNAMTVYLASKLGIDRIREVGKRFGIYESLPAEYSAVLGARETTLIDLVNAYAMLVNGGKRVKPALIERIDDRYGKVIYKRDQRECDKCTYRTVPSHRSLEKEPPRIPDNRETVVDSATAFQMTYMLQGVVERGTAVRAKRLGMPLGGKTGTTNDSRDAWFIGFSPDLVVGLYVGFDTPKPLGSKETGSSVALPGFIKFMELAKKQYPTRPFAVPEGIKMVKIDRWTGYPAYYGGGREVITEAFKSYEQPGYVAQPQYNHNYGAGQQGSWPDYQVGQQPYGQPSPYGQQDGAIIYDEDQAVTVGEGAQQSLQPMPANPNDRWQPVEPIRQPTQQPQAQPRERYYDRRNPNRSVTNPYYQPGQGGYKPPPQQQPAPAAPNFGTGGLY